MFDTNEGLAPDAEGLIVLIGLYEIKNQSFQNVNF